MKQPKTVGLALILLGTLVLLGNTTEALPAEAFFAGLFLYPIGGVLFFQGSRASIQQAETRAANIRAPQLKNATAEAYAERQRRNIERTGSDESQLRSLQQGQKATPPAPFEALEIDLDLDPELDDEEEFAVTTDVSFPIEVQEQDSLAEQLMKLQKLRDGGVISEEELAIAKAKLLS